MGKNGTRKNATPWASMGYTSEVKAESWSSLWANAVAGLMTLAVVAGTVLAVVAQFVK